MTHDELARALRCRFEADALLGVDFLPVHPLPPVPKAMAGAIPAQRPGGPAAMTGVARPAPTTGMPGRAAAAGPSPAAGPALGMAPTAIQPLPPRAPIGEEETRERRGVLQVIDEREVKPCTKCGLAKTRTKTVFGVGSPTARIVFVGEAPGADEDATGEPFVGRAGQLLTDMIQKGMGLRREEVYICNVLKCRPPNNRQPAGDEIAACRDYLWRQLEIIRPEVIIALGAPAAKTLLGTTEGIGMLRGRFHDFYLSGSAMAGAAIPLMPTFHPAYLLRSPGEKTKAWSDLKMVMALLGIPLPKRE